MLRPNKISQPSWMLTLASIAVVIVALYLAKGVLVPLTLAVLLSFLLSPVCDWLERWRLGRIPAVLMTAILGFTLLGIVTWTATVQITSLAPKIPEYQSNLEAKLSSVNAYAVAAMMLAQVLEASGCRAQAISVTALAGEMVDLVDQCTAADVICISATPPAAVMHARYLSKRLRGRLPEASLVVGLWDAQGDLHKTKERIGCDAIVVATLAAAQAQIGTQIQPNVPPPHTPSQHGPRIMAGTHR